MSSFLFRAELQQSRLQSELESKRKSIDALTSQVSNIEEQRKKLQAEKQEADVKAASAAQQVRTFLSLSLLPYFLTHLIFFSLI